MMSTEAMHTGGKKTHQQWVKDLCASVKKKKKEEKEIEWEKIEIKLTGFSTVMRTEYFKATCRP